MPDMYKQIEKRIVQLKKKEDVWKGRYREIAKEVEDLVESNSKRMKDMDSLIKGFESRIRGVETVLKNSNSRAEQASKSLERRIREFSESVGKVSQRVAERDAEMKKAKEETASFVSTAIARHEKTFESVIEKINAAVSRMESGLARNESLSGRMEPKRGFLEGYSPPDFPRPALQDAMIPDPPAPVSYPQPEPAYEPDPPSSAPASLARPRRRSAFDLDDDIEVNDLISGNINGFQDSVSSMNMRLNSIAGRLASIEEKVSGAGPGKSKGVERLDDKIRMYLQSVADMRSRMEVVEKAVRDGMTPMMETMVLLTEAVKGMKDSGPRPGIRRPEPPEPRRDALESQARPVRKFRYSYTGD